MKSARLSDLVTQSRRQGRVREKGLQSVSVITRLAVAASLVLSAVFTVIAAKGFAGRTTTATGGTTPASSGGAGSAATVRIALPPKGGDQGSSSGITPPVAPPVSQPIVQAPPVTSGGS